MGLLERKPEAKISCPKKCFNSSEISENSHFLSKSSGRTLNPIFSLPFPALPCPSSPLPCPPSSTLHLPANNFSSHPWPQLKAMVQKCAGTSPCMVLGVVQSRGCVCSSRLRIETHGQNLRFVFFFNLRRGCQFLLTYRNDK